MDIPQLLVLKRKGLSNRKAASLLGVHRNPVNPYVRLFTASGATYESLLKLTDNELTDLFPCPAMIDKGRYEDLILFRIINAV